MADYEIIATNDDGTYTVRIPVNGRSVDQEFVVPAPPDPLTVLDGFVAAKHAELAALDQASLDAIAVRDKTQASYDDVLTYMKDNDLVALVQKLAVDLGGK